MGFGRSLPAFASLTMLWAGCGTAPRLGLDATLASCVPTETRALAGIHLDSVRTNPLLHKVFGVWLPLLDRAGDASSVLIAYNGKDLVWAGRGQFLAAPPGATLLNPQLAIAGPEAAVRAATAQHATGKTGAPALVAQAAAVAGQPIWAVIAGDLPLPLSGNAANMNRLLSMTEYTTLAIESNAGLTLHAAGICRSPDQARQLEQTLRGLVALVRATTRDRVLSDSLDSLQISNDKLTVYADLSGSERMIERLLPALGGSPAAPTGR